MKRVGVIHKIWVGVAPIHPIRNQTDGYRVFGLGVVWAGLVPTLILGMAPTLLFCLVVGSGSFQFLVWFEDCMGLEPTRHLFGWMDWNET